MITNVKENTMKTKEEKILTYLKNCTDEQLVQIWKDKCDPGKIPITFYFSRKEIADIVWDFNDKEYSEEIVDKVMEYIKEDYEDICDDLNQQFWGFTEYCMNKALEE